MYAFREDCNYDSSDQQSVGKVHLFRAPLTPGMAPTTTLVGTQVFGQLGFSVNVGRYGDVDVLAVGTVTAGQSAFCHICDPLVDLDQGRMHNVYSRLNKRKMLT